MIKAFAFATLVVLSAPTLVQARADEPRIPSMADPCPQNPIATDGSRLPNNCYRADETIDRAPGGRQDFFGIYQAR